jgi:hypothetical protein
MGRLGQETGNSDVASRRRDEETLAVLRRSPVARGAQAEVDGIVERDEGAYDEPEDGPAVLDAFESREKPRHLLENNDAGLRFASEALYVMHGCVRGKRRQS